MPLILNIHYLAESSVAVVPLIAGRECIGVMITGDNNYEAHSEI